MNYKKPSIPPSIIIIRNLLCIPSTFAFYFIIIFLCTIFPTPDVKTVLGLPKAQIVGDIDYNQFSKWIVLICAPFLVNGLLLERSKLIDRFSSIRLHGRWHYIRNCATACVINSAIWVLCLSGWAWLLGLRDFFSFFLIFCSNSLLWAILECAIYYFCGRRAWTGALLVIGIGSMCLLADRQPLLSNVMPTTWGMLCRSNNYQQGGLSIICMLFLNIFTGFTCGLLFQMKGAHKYGNDTSKKSN